MVTVGTLAELCKSTFLLLSVMFLFGNFLAIIGGFACFVFYRLLIERVVFVFGTYSLILKLFYA